MLLLQSELPCCMTQHRVTVCARVCMCCGAVVRCTIILQLHTRTLIDHVLSLLSLLLLIGRVLLCVVLDTLLDVHR
jgi:hypothetical protein